MRKTNDETILKMLSEGKTQKMIAQYFGVSPVAIHKRIKRLAPPPRYASLQSVNR
jgi:DNA-binding NarL/FixJ family response regulator